MFKFSTKLCLFLLTLNFSAIAQFGGPSPVKVDQVQELMMAPTRLVPANVQAKFISSIKAESRGIVNQLADIGSHVKQGEILAELTDTQSKLRQQELKDAVQSARAQYEFFKLENKRLLDLVKKNLISKSELDKNKSDLLTAKGDLDQSISRLNQYKDQVTKLSILAPFDGYVMQQFAQPGQLLNSGDDALEFMQANNLEVVVNVPFQYKSQIIKDAIWMVESTDGTINEAKISKFIPAATGQSHTIEVHLLVDNNDLWPGESVNVEVPKETARKVIAIPRDALVIRKSGSYVYTIVEGKSHKVDVITGIAQGAMIEAKGLLSAGDIVIVRGNERLMNDQAVKIIDN
jgi:RND family efflux transporter MFP subunit